ncbi:Sphingomyelin phosphodiesterase [Quillaja saponaria]|uniref:Sphingomyelin phosphodiesterase n=1 Tax=Quillaja saponaria TaxID=32244 RepID=A0AAD7P784_QUISA|nr:Sphingomyelin phosphodiesterase [Quillaja saponaria]
MLPHSYTIDSQSKSQDLAHTITTSSTSHQIFSTCAAIESFLQSHSPDQSRHFFSVAFPALICKLFGFDDANSSPGPHNSPSGWIDYVLASNDSELAHVVFSLLCPNGTLMNSISSVDRLSLVKYVFPTERLPEWTRYMLSKDKDCRVLSDLCPLFRGKVKEDSVKGSSFQIQLNVFEYYTFWFAYYPVCRGNCENFDDVSNKRARRFRLEDWASAIPGFSSAKRGMEQKIECNLYRRLLYAYLRAFVPIYDLNAHQPYRSSLLHSASGYDDSVMMRAEFFVNTLIHFWLVDNDFSPLPVNVCKSFGVTFPFWSVLGETPPTSGLGEVVKLFVKYLNLSSVAGTENIECSWSPRWMASGLLDKVKSRDVPSISPRVQSVGSWNPCVQRTLYRFLLRTFLFCPVATSIKNASHVFSVWVSYMEPWMITLDEFSELDAIIGESPPNLKRDSQPETRGFTPAWNGYVLSNYLYYSSLVMHFIGFAHKFLHSDVEIIVQMVLKVMDTLTSSKVLIDLLRNVDTVFHSKQAGSGKSMLNSLYRYIPSIREQLQDWEDGLCESDADGSFLHENWNKDLRLFSDGEDGGQQLLQLFVLRAESELQSIFGDNLAHSLQCIDSIKARMGCLFDEHSVKSFSVSPQARQCQQSRDEIFKPRRGGNHALDNMKYRGDWMNRPISNDEVAWLAKLLVRLSAWLNESVQLNQAEISQVAPTGSYVEVSTDVANVCGPSETLKVVLCAVGSWFLLFGAGAVRLMRKYGLRVNLRVLASKKIVMVLVLYAVFSILKKFVVPSLGV